MTVYTIPPNAPFLRALAKQIFAGAFGAPIRRSCRSGPSICRRGARRRCWKAASSPGPGNPALLLPRIRAVGDAEEDIEDPDRSAGARRGARALLHPHGPYRRLAARESAGAAGAEIAASPGPRARSRRKPRRACRQPRDRRDAARCPAEAHSTSNSAATARRSSVSSRSFKAPAGAACRKGRARRGSASRHHRPDAASSSRAAALSGRRRRLDRHDPSDGAPPRRHRSAAEWRGRVLPGSISAWTSELGRFRDRTRRPP